MWKNKSKSLRNDNFASYLIFVFFDQKLLHWIDIGSKTNNIVFFLNLRRLLLNSIIEKEARKLHIPKTIGFHLFFSKVYLSLSHNYITPTPEKFIPFHFCKVLLNNNQIRMNIKHTSTTLIA